MCIGVSLLFCSTVLRLAAGKDRRGEIPLDAGQQRWKCCRRGSMVKGSQSAVDEAVEGGQIFQRTVFGGKGWVGFRKPFCDGEQIFGDILAGQGKNREPDLVFGPGDDLYFDQEVGGCNVDEPKIEGVNEVALPDREGNVIIGVRLLHNVAV